MKKLGKYYMDLEDEFHRPDQHDHKLDKKGVIINKIPYTNEWDYFPVAIAGYGLANFQKYRKTGFNKYKKAFLQQASWLVDNITIKNNDLGVWEHYFSLPFYDFKIPWVHGMAQGWGISLLLRAFEVTKKDFYLDTAKKAYRAFEVDIPNGGVRFVDDDGNVWLEEYAILPPPHVLNGFIYTLFGVYDFYIFTNSKKCLTLWKNCIKTLEKKLILYDTGYWSKYDLLSEIPATLDYQNLHVKQLQVLYKLTKNEVFSKFSMRWNKYLNNPINVKISLLMRGKKHLKKHGIGGCIKRYFERREWIKK